MSTEDAPLTGRARRRRIRQLRRQIRHRERRWERLNRAHGLPPRPAIDAHYDALDTLADELRRLL